MQECPEQLSEVIHHYLQTLKWVSADYQLTPLMSESSNDTYRLVTKGQTYFVKYFGLTQFIPYDRQKVFQIQLALAEHGLAVKPVVISPDLKIQIEQWQPKSTELERGSCISQSARILGQLHQIDVSAEPLELVEHWQKYIELCPENKKLGYARRIEHLKHFWKAEELTHLCHNDLSFDHIVSPRLTLLYDWEYVARGNRFFDLASVIEVNRLSEAESQLFLQLYAQENDMALEEVQQGVVSMYPLVKLTSEIWWEAYHYQSNML